MIVVEGWRRTAPAMKSTRVLSSAGTAVKISAEEDREEGHEENHVHAGTSLGAEEGTASRVRYSQLYNDLGLGGDLHAHHIAARNCRYSKAVSAAAAVHGDNHQLSSSYL